MRNWLLLLCCLAVLYSKAQPSTMEDSLTLAFNQGLSSYSARNYADAQLQLEKVIHSATNDIELEGRAQRIMGLIHYRQGAYSHAPSYFLRAIELFTILKQFRRVAACQKDLANVYTRQGDYDKAIFLQSSSLSTNLQMPRADYDYEEIAFCLMDLGKAYYHKNEFSQAINYYEQARQTPQISAFTQALARLSLGQTLSVQGDPEAIAHLDFALKQFQKEQAYGYEMDCLLILGDFFDLQDKEQAAAYYRQAMALSQEVFETPFRREVSKISLRQGKLYEEMGKEKKALMHYQKALFWVLPQEVDTTDFYQKPPDSLFYCENVILQALEGKANCFAASGAASHALAHYQAMVVAEERLRNCQDYQSSKLQLAGNHRKSIARGLAVATENPKFVEEAFFLMEKSKAKVMNETLQEVQSRAAYLPDSLLAEENMLAQAIADITGELAVSKTKDPLLQRQLDSLRYQQALFREHLQAHYPAYHRASLRLAYRPLEEVQANLPQGHLLIHYFEQAASDEGFALAVSRDQARLYTLDSLGERPQQLRGLLEGASFLSPREEVDTYAAVAHSLFERCLLPILNDYPSYSSLILLPDGPLSEIPFEALLVEKPDFLPDTPPETYENFWKGKARVGKHGAAYLMFDYQVQYAFSAGLWLGGKKSKKPTQLMQAYSPAYSKTDSFGGRRITPLNSANSNALAVAKLFDEGSLTGSQGSSSVFLAQAHQARYVHLALHAFADQVHPLRSALAFSKPADAPHGFVFAADLYAMPPLSATLVSLLACKSGDGKQVQGEGILSLGRAFRLAGTEGVVMSLWDADARLGGKILEGMYGAIREGISVPTALQHAKHVYLSSASAADAHPRYWASYVLIGNPQSAEKSSFLPWLLVVGVLALAFMIFWVAKKRP